MARAVFYLLCGTLFYDAVCFHDELFCREKKTAPICCLRAWRSHHEAQSEAKKCFYCCLIMTIATSLLNVHLMLPDDSVGWTWRVKFPSKLNFNFFLFQILAMGITSTIQQEQVVTLGIDCHHDMDCSDHIKGSYCSLESICECSPFYVMFNETVCLPCKFNELRRKFHKFFCVSSAEKFLILMMV